MLMVQVETLDGNQINRCLSLNVQLNLQELQFAVLIPKKGVEGEGCLS